MPAPSTRHIEPLLSLIGPPQNTVAPLISGTPVVGQTLSTTNGTWDSAATFAYQWQRDGGAIGGANTSTYDLVTADLGHTITAVITATSTIGLGTGAPASSNGLTVVDELVTDNIQFWTAADSGLGGSPAVEVPSPTSVFDSVTHSEAVTGDVEYRLVYLLNTHPSRSLTSTVIWVAVQTTSATTDIAIGVAPEAAGSDAASIPNEATPPTSVTFTAPDEISEGLDVGLLGPGEARGIWLRRRVLAGSADLAADLCTLAWAGTPA